MDRRSLLDEGDRTPTHERGDVFGDEYEVEDYEFVADGFRPDSRGSTRDVAEQGVSSRQGSIHSGPIRTVSAHYAPGPVSPSASAGVSRNSTRKSRGGRNPFMGEEEDEEDETSPLDPRQSLQFEPDDLPGRVSMSSTSSRIFPQSATPRFGSAGPSHPYAMYPQGTVARTPSNATTSTTRPTRQSSTRQGPSHPYAMYPQGVEEDLDDDDDDDLRQNPVQVGFPGLGSNYTRRVGPDGEEQDIIGDYGHTEQLPPYSRYPDEGPEKMPLLMPTALHSRAPVAGSDPTMPLMHTALQPLQNPQSMTDESALNRQSSLNSLLPTSSSDSSINSAKKSWKEKTWREKRRHRLCGIPLWWIMIAAGVVVFVLAVISGVIGGFIAGKHGSSSSNTITVVTTLLDASVIASPTSGAPVTGTFALSLSPPQETQCECLPQQSQKAAWSCDLVPNQALGMVVGPNASGRNGASIFYAAKDQRIFYGAQVWSLETDFAEFLTVQDNDDPDNGPAFYFQQTYDKIVVLPEDAFDPSTKKIKRGYGPGRHNWGFNHQYTSMPTPGDKPWFCVWNNTFLEGFIYVQKPKATTTSSIHTTTSSIASKTTSSAFGSTTPFFPNMMNPMTTTMTFASTTATFTGVSSAFPAWSNALANARKEYPDIHRSKRQTSNDGDADDGDSDDFAQWNSLQQYPFVMKLEERRLPNNEIQPYCQQYQILYSLSANFVQGPDGQPIKVELEEDDPSYGAYQSAGIAGSSRNVKRTDPGGCHCQWIAGSQ